MFTFILQFGKISIERKLLAESIESIFLQRSNFTNHKNAERRVYMQKAKLSLKLQHEDDEEVKITLNLKKIKSN